MRITFSDRKIFQDLKIEPIYQKWYFFTVEIVREIDKILHEKYGIFFAVDCNRWMLKSDTYM